MPVAYQPPPPPRPLAVGGLLLALGLPALALVESHVWTRLSEAGALVILSATPWLVLAWVLFAERQPLSSIGFRRPGRSTLGFALAGIVVNVAISAIMNTLNTHLGLHETASGLLDRLLQSSGWVVVLLATNGALLTEIAFRGYTIERLTELANNRSWLAAGAQIIFTTLLFIVSRGLGHALVWLVDDLVFTAFYLWRRDLWVCVLAHAVPNLVASTLVATGVAT